MLLSKLFLKSLLLTSALAVVHISPAFADAKDDRIAAMEAQMKIMMVLLKIQNGSRPKT